MKKRIIKGLSRQKLMEQIRTLGHPAIEIRLVAVVDALEFIHGRSSTDDHELQAFLAGMGHALAVIKQEED